MLYEKKNSYTLAILVNNKAGVLMRVVALFSRRGYNIDSLSVGVTEDPSLSRITVAVTGDKQIVEQITRQLEKLIDVIRVYEMTSSSSVQRELMLIKVKADTATRSQVVEIANLFKAKIIDVDTTTLVMQIAASIETLESFLTLIKPYGIVELVRTGITALERGSRALSEISLGDQL